jgi:hypothetical protein
MNSCLSWALQVAQAIGISRKGLKIAPTDVCMHVIGFKPGERKNKEATDVCASSFARHYVKEWVLMVF